MAAMAGGGGSAPYWCYNCRREVTSGAEREGDSAVCAVCGSGFIEDLRTAELQPTVARRRERAREVQGNFGRATEDLRAILQSLGQMQPEELRQLARGERVVSAEVLQRLGLMEPFSSEGNGDAGGGGVGQRIQQVQSSSRNESESTGGVDGQHALSENSEPVSALNEANGNVSGEGESSEGTNVSLSVDGNQGREIRNEEEEAAQALPALSEDLENRLEMMEQAFAADSWELTSGDEDDEEDEWEEWVEGEQDEEEEEEQDRAESGSVNEGEDEDSDGPALGDDENDQDYEVEVEVEVDVESRQLEVEDRQRTRGISQGARERDGGIDFAATLQQLLQNLEVRVDRVREIVMVGNAGGMYIGNPGDYLDAQGFETFVQHMAANDNSWRGPPPASKAAIDELVTVLVNEAHVSSGVSLCAICKDTAEVGALLVEMPCSHLYHGDCIKQWLSTRNSCPVCRFELPTDDQDYEEQRRSRESRRRGDVTAGNRDRHLPGDGAPGEAGRSENEIEGENDSSTTFSSRVPANTGNESHRNRDVNVLTVSHTVVDDNQVQEHFFVDDNQVQEHFSEQMTEELSSTDSDGRLPTGEHSDAEAIPRDGALIGVRRNSLLDVVGRVLQLGGFFLALYIGHRLGRSAHSEEDHSLFSGNSLPARHGEGGAPNFRDRYSAD